MYLKWARLRKTLVKSRIWYASRGDTEMDQELFTLPLWLRSTHLINFILMGIVLRSGWEILASLPRLWWRNDCKPGTEWLRFTRRKLQIGRASCREREE